MTKQWPHGYPYAPGHDCKQRQWLHAGVDAADSAPDRPRCPQCGAFLSRQAGWSTAYQLGLVEADYVCANPRCMLNRRRG